MSSLFPSHKRASRFSSIPGRWTAGLGAWINARDRKRGDISRGQEHSRSPHSQGVLGMCDLSAERQARDRQSLRGCILIGRITQTIHLVAGDRRDSRPRYLLLESGVCIVLIGRNIGHVCQWQKIMWELRIVEGHQ